MRRHLFIVGVFGLSLLATPAGAQESRHPSVEFGPLRLDFKARAEVDVYSAAPEAGRYRAELDWQLPRVEVAGRLWRQIEFEISREFGGSEPDDGEWKDIFLTFRVRRGLEISGGRLKIPFGRETLVARANLDFINRSLGSTQLTPSRDTGLVVHGRLLGSRLRYEAGYFDRDGDNARTEHAAGGQDTVVGRVVLRPFAGATPPASSLHLGLAIARSRVEDRLGLRGRTVLEDGVFFDRLYVNGRRLRTGLEAFWAAGPASVAGEYIAVSDQRLGMGFHLDDLEPVNARAWHVAATWAITGERKNGRLEPKRKPGAVELVGRIEDLRFDDVLHPGAAFSFPATSTFQANEDRVATVGVNWYVARVLRIQYNVVFEKIADAGRSPAPTNSGRLTTGLFRVQVTI